MSVMNTLMMTASGAGSACPELEGTLWTWGRGVFWLGHNTATTTNYSVPTQVGTLTDWTNNVGGWDTDNAGVAHHWIKSDGTLWGWGKNNYGRLGDGTTTDRSSPVQVGALTDWARVDNGHGGYHSVAVKTDGTLWSWGYNVQGQLGQGDTTNRSSPVQVGSLTDWASVSCGQNFSVMLKTDGTLWATGWNNYGQCGDGTTTYRSSPVQVGSATNWLAFETITGAVRALASA